MTAYAVMRSQWWLRGYRDGWHGDAIELSIFPFNLSSRLRADYEAGHARGIEARRTDGYPPPTDAQVYDVA